jgi:DNA polymerase III epsilon subunit-like protein
MTKTPIYVVIDTETSGVPLYIGFNVPACPDNTKAYNMARIIEIGAVISDSDGNELSRFRQLVNPTGNYAMSPQAENVHGISKEHLAEHGVGTELMLTQIAHILSTYESVGRCVLVGHNIRFDWSVLLSEAIRANHKRLINVLRYMPTHCTMMTSTRLCGLRRKNGSPKWPKLCELYQQLFPDDPPVQILHSALDDALVTAKCFFEARRSSTKSGCTTSANSTTK